MRNRKSLYDEDFTKYLSSIQKTTDTNIEDYKNFVVSSGNKFFTDSYNSLLHKKLIKEYLIPKIEGDDITIQCAAEKIGIDKNTAKDILKGKRMKEFLKIVT